MTHPDWEALLRTIARDPADDLPRLVAADWLDDHPAAFPDAAGPGAGVWVRRAELIRVQCALARGPDPALAGRERELFRWPHDRLAWAAEACPELFWRRPPLRSPSSGGGRGFRRGFLEVVTCPAADWLAHGRAVCARQPVREVHLTAAGGSPAAAWWELLPLLAGLDRVTAAGADGFTAAFLAERVPGFDRGGGV